MDYLDLINKNLSHFKTQINSFEQEAVLENTDEIKKWIKERWKLGKTPDGDLIGRYSKSEMGAEYAFFKNQINPLPGVGNVDLTLTGALGKGIRVLPHGQNQYIVFSTDNKFNAIADKYGYDNFNLSEEEFTKLANAIIDYLANELNKKYK